MPLNRPGLEDLNRQIGQDIRARLPGARPELRRSLLGVLAAVEAGALHGLYGRLVWLSRQVMVDTAEAEYLERWAAVWGIARRPSTPASGSLIFTGEEDIEIPAGTRLQADDGTEYATTDTDRVEVSGDVVIPVEAVAAGAGGAQDAGAHLRLQQVIPGVESEAEVSAGADGSGFVAGSDAESDAGLRARLLDRIQRPPHGGARRDYEAWALEIPGVTRVWVTGLEQGAGTVTIRIATDEAEGAPIPAAATVQAVQEYIDSLRPVTAEVFVVAPVAVPLDLDLGITPDTDETRTAVEEAVKLILRDQGAPGATIRISRLRTAVALAAGVEDYTLTSPAADIPHDTGELPVLGEIAWQ